MCAKSTQTNNHPAIEVFPDDIFLVSYPKSGSTWLRSMAGNYLSGNQCDLTKLPSLMPEVYHNLEHLAQVPKPRIIKSHEPFVAEYDRVVYLARDGRDVAVSYYFFALKAQQLYPQFTSKTTFEEFVHAFNAGHVDGFTRWSEHVSSWLDQARDNFLLIKYEDMKANPAAELVRFLNFAGIAVDDDRVAQAVKASNFRNMRKNEQEIYYQFEGFDPSDPSFVYFMRKGEVGDWQAFFTDQMLADFIEIHGAALEQLGYLPPRIAAGFKGRRAEQLIFQQIQIQLKKQELISQQLQTQLNQVRERSQQRQRKLKAKLRETQATINAMESSKFWQLRTYWLQFKNLLVGWLQQT